MNKIKIVLLESLCEEIIDCPHTTPEWLFNGIPVLRNYNLNNGFIDTSNLSYVDEDTYLDRIRRGTPMGGDIVISREAPIGAVCIIPEGYKCCLGQRLVLLKVNKDICNEYYLLYLLMSDFVRKQMGVYERRGSIVSNLNISYLKELKIPFVEDKNYQNKIVKILFGLDSQIERNNAMFQKLLSFVYTICCISHKKGELQYAC